MAGVSANRNNLLAVRLLALRRHLMSCRRCKGAMDAEDYSLLCESTCRDVLFIAAKWDSNIAGRLAVRRAGDTLLFLCPDVNAHGAAYAATAEPVTVHSSQGALF